MKLLFEEEKTSTCKGHVYSYRENTYIGGRGEVVEKHTFTPLKRNSCPGCEECGGIIDMLSEWISVGMIPYPKNLNDGDSVLLVAINDGRGFEDCYDEWHLEFKKKITKGAAHCVLAEKRKDSKRG